MRRSFREFAAFSFCRKTSGTGIFVYKYKKKKVSLYASSPLWQQTRKAWSIRARPLAATVSFCIPANWDVSNTATGMNSFTKYDNGTLASAYFEYTRRTDADFRRRIYDLSEWNRTCLEKICLIFFLCSEYNNMFESNRLKIEHSRDVYV